MKHFSALVLATLSLAALPATALAQDASEGYGSVAGVSTGSGTSPAGSNSPTATRAAVSDSGSTLPFTGLDVALVGGAGIALIGGGLAMRRMRVE